MQSKTLPTHEIPNYTETILQVANYTKGAPVKSHRHNLHKKLAEKYVHRDEIQFFKRNGQFVHHLGQLNTGRPKWQRKTLVIIQRIFLYLNEDGTIGWNIKEVE